ncbi:MAG TPA: Mrp/NBP35 family ATP-binding protein [Candidatus Binataceae bacterium]|nr:Mrp/NBP35 family ATP-binding protein [Candidatus Binataceae bacterium]
MPSPQEILTRLKSVKFPGFERDIVSFNLIKDIEVSSAGVVVSMGPISRNPELAQAVALTVKRTVEAMDGTGQVRVEVESAKPPPPSREEAMASRRGVPGVSHVIAVASGKGGVGKSTVAVNLALALAGMGLRIGLMDADVYGPSAAMMLGADAVEVDAQRRIIPLQRYGIRYISMALFVGDQAPVIWRGPMVTKLETEFLFNVEWGELDCLVLDLPPGTGDAQLTITQRVALDGGVIVTTPQEVALLDVRRGVTMFNEVQTPVLGIIENMSYYLCGKCGHRHQLFGSGGGARMAAELNLPLLGELPLVPALREGSDLARPLVASNPGHPISQEFRAIAEQVWQRINNAPTPQH